MTSHRRRLWRRHCTAAILVLSIRTAGAQAPAPSPVTGSATYNVFVLGADVGREQVSVQRSGTNWIITSTGRVADMVINRFELKYTADWQPVELRIEVTQGPKTLQLATSFQVTTAVSEITQNGVTNSKTDQISARTVVLPNNFYAAYEGLAARLAGLQAGAELPVYVAPQAETKLTVKSVSAERVQTPSGPVGTQRFAVTIQNPDGTLDASIVVDQNSRFARLEIPTVGLTVVRSDLASVAARTERARNPTDSDVTIPAEGFNIAGTLTMPPAMGRLRNPAVVLVTGSGSLDRDETVAGIPIFSQLARGLSERGFVVLRYDKRGTGQSGGRSEAVTLKDYSDDLIRVVKWLARRDDVDGRRITVAGHSEGGAVALVAAGREKKFASVVLLASPGTTGAELILEQQRHQLDVMKASDADRAEKIALQQRIQQAVLSGSGWEGIPPQIRRQADTPWFRSFLTFDPAAAVKKTKQPILIVQGDVDTQVPPHHAQRLAEAARARKKAGPVEVVHLPAVNHLLVKAETGEVQEYAQLKEKNISQDVVATIADWLKRLP